VDARRLKELFIAALELDGVDRAALLERQCAQDPELRLRVEALLQAHDSPGDFLVDAGASFSTESDQGGSLDPTSAFRAVIPHGGILIAGRYTLEELIGEGGMGEVWVAMQTQPVKRKVALKLIKSGMDSRGVLARFEQERQALALMDHPNIARVLDGGLT